MVFNNKFLNNLNIIIIILIKNDNSHKKELINHNTSSEMFTFFKEQLIELYSQLSVCETIQSNMFIEFLKRTNAYLYVDGQMNIHLGRLLHYMKEK